MTPRELAEREGKPIALDWIDAAERELSGYAARLGTGRPHDPRALVSAALAINFSLPADEATAQRLEVVEQILETYARARAILLRSERYFVGVSEAAARNLFPATQHPGLPPAYAIFDEAIYFTPRFEPWDASSGRGFGPLCRAAMVLHESVHVIDLRSGEPEIHVSEWDEPAFSGQTVEQSLHNPSSYASFAAQTHSAALEWPRPSRYGAGRPAD